MTKVVRIGIILVITLGLSLPASALDIGLGLDLDLIINSTTTEGTSTAGRTATTTKNVRDTNSFGIGANVILRLNDILEITPSLKLTIAPSTAFNPYLHLGSAFYWHLVRGNVFELSLGPSAYTGIGFAASQNMYLTFGVNADVVLDMKFNPSLIFRAKVTLAGLGLGIINMKSAVFVLSSGTGIAVPMSFGLIYMF